MQKRQNAPSQGLILQVGAAASVALPFFSKEEAEVFLGATEKKRKAAMKAAFYNVIGKKSPNGPAATQTNPALESWVAFYRKHFPIALDVAGGEDVLRTLSLPTPRTAEFTRLIVVLKGLTPNRVYDACAANFKSWRYSDDLDSNIPVNERTPANGSYAVWVRDSVEADEEFANVSANDLTARGIKGITTLERVLLELKYFDETGDHLDKVNVTLCGGSRGAGGDVSSADWGGEGFRVGWSHPARRDPELRVREVSV